MGLTGELIESCRKSLGELERIIAHSEVEPASYRGDRERWRDRRFHERAKAQWERWEGNLYFRLNRLGIIQSWRSTPFRELKPFTELEPALRSIEELANRGSVDALEALCQLAIMSARGIIQLRRIQYIREHPYPWQESSRTRAAVIEEVADAEVSKMIKEVGKGISEEEQDGEEKLPES
ncbi:MAG: hypothetical protein ACRD2G_01710 [Terriglobia bacterium]